MRTLATYWPSLKSLLNFMAVFLRSSNAGWKQYIVRLYMQALLMFQWRSFLEVEIGRLPHYCEYVVKVGPDC